MIILFQRQKQTGGESVVITFSPHPRLVLSRKPKASLFLTTLEEKKKLLAETAELIILIIIEFTKEFSNMEACDFIKDILVEKIGTKHLIIGYDQSFREEEEKVISNNSGDVLNYLILMLNRSVKFYEEDGIISSSSIREALLKGRLEEANRWLGYYYSLQGQWYKAGRSDDHSDFRLQISNLTDQFKLIPANGVYAVEVQT